MTIDAPVLILNLCAHGRRNVRTVLWLHMCGVLELASAIRSASFELVRPDCEPERHRQLYNSCGFGNDLLVQAPFHQLCLNEMYVLCVPVSVEART